MRYRNLFVVLVTLLTAAVAVAGVPEMKFRRLDTRDGLSNSNILALLRDSRGLVWIGTPYGLNRYDGYRIRTFLSSANDTLTLRNNYVDAIMEDGQGRLWLRQGMNFCVFDPTTERADRHPEWFVQKMGVEGGLEYLFIDRDKNLWVKTFETGLWRVDGKTHKVTAHIKPGYGAGELNSDVAAADMLDDGKRVYLSSTNGEVFCLDRQKGTIVWKNAFLRQQYGISNSGCKLRDDGQGNLWVVTNNHNYILNLKSSQWKGSVQEQLHAWGVQEVPAEMDVWDVAADAEGRVWLATDHGGIYVVDPKDGAMRQLLTNKLDQSTISDNTLRVLMNDQLGRMWVGTYMNGVNLYTGSAVGIVNMDFGNINTVCADRQGNWWLGTNDKGIIRYNPKTEEQMVYNRENSGFRSNTMVGSLVARDGSIWFGTYEGGIIHIKNGQVRNITATNDTTGLANNNVWSLCEDQWGNVWIGTLGSGVQRIDKRTGRMRTIRMSNSLLPSDYISTVGRSNRGWMLVAHTQYISFINPQTLKVANFDITKNEQNVPIAESCITGMEDSRGLIWQGSSNGAVIWDRKANHVYWIDIKKGLQGSSVNGMLEDKEHHVWLTTDHGVSNVIPQQQEDGTWTFVMRSYNNRDGLQNGPFNQRSMCYTPDGLILVGGQEGLDIINPQNMGKGRIKEAPIFSGLQIFDRDISVGAEYEGRVILDEALDVCRELSLRFNDQFTIQLGSTSGELHNRSRFVYMLEGFNGQWIRTSEQNPNITYNSLRAGSYTLRVRMLNDDGTIGDEEATLDITIRPPLWRARWMILLYMLLIAAAAWYWRKWWMKRQVKRMEVESRRRELEKTQWMNEMRLKLAQEARQQGYQHAEEAAPEVQQPAVEVHLTLGDLVTFSRQFCSSYVAPEGKEAKINFVAAVQQLEADFDAEKLKEIYTILFRNSIHFTPYDSVISVGVARTRNGQAQIQVADNGIGIQDQYKEHAFDPIVNGEGIGLDYVKGIVDAHGGDIRIEDNPCGGTIFIITLPCIEEAEMM